MAISLAAIISSSIFGGLGMLDSGLSYSSRKKKAQNAIDDLEAQKDRQLELSQLQFELDQKNAFKKADEANRQTTLAEALFGSNANITFNNLGLQQEAKTLEYNLAAIQSGAAEGSGYQTIATSGTRNSSAKQAVDMQSNLNAEQLQLQQDIDRKHDTLTLASAMNSIAQGTDNLQTRRNEAKDLRDTYSEGGDVYNLYQKKRENYIADVKAQTDRLEEEKKWKWQDTVNLLTAGIAGANTGYNFGLDIDKWMLDWKSPKLQKGTEIDTNSISFDNIGTGYNNNKIFIG